MRMSAESVRQDNKTITSYDVLKTLAVFLMIVDHIGLFLYPDIEMLRAVGRLSAPIWLFLIGFARSRDVPFSWLFWCGLDLALSLAMGFVFETNMLLTLALIRWSLQYIEPVLYPRGLYTIAFAVFCLVMAPLTMQVTTYGSIAWLLAAVGLWVRRDGAAGMPWIMGVFLAYFVTESLGFGFGNAEMLVFAGGMMCIAMLLVYFDPDARIRLSSTLTTGIYQFFGKHSLLFYAIHLLGLKILWRFLH